MQIYIISSNKDSKIPWSAVGSAHYKKHTCTRPIHVEGGVSVVPLVPIWAHLGHARRNKTWHYAQEVHQVARGKSWSEMPNIFKKYQDSME